MRGCRDIVFLWFGVCCICTSTLCLCLYEYIVFVDSIDVQKAFSIIFNSNISAAAAMVSLLHFCAQIKSIRTKSCPYNYFEKVVKQCMCLLSVIKAWDSVTCLMLRYFIINFSVHGHHTKYTCSQSLQTGRIYFVKVFIAFCTWTLSRKNCVNAAYIIV